MLIDGCIHLELTNAVSTSTVLPSWSIPESISVFKNIKVLDFSHGLTTDTSSLFNIDAISRLKKLTILNLDGNKKLLFNADSKLFYKLKNLKILKMNRLAIDNIIFLMCCNHLDHLELDYCLSLDKKDVIKIAKSLSQVKVRSLRYASGKGSINIAEI